MSDRELHYLWCDGFEPSEYVLDGTPPSIRGQAWMSGRGDKRWRFVLLLPAAIEDRAAYDWSALLPPEDATGWLSPDPVAEVLVIEPAAAVPDAES